jgi:hypothetical protein
MATGLAALEIISGSTGVKELAAQVQPGLSARGKTASVNSHLKPGPISASRYLRAETVCAAFERLLTRLGLFD